MGKDSFRYLYPIITAALNGTDSFMSEALKSLDVKSERGFKEEAAKLLAYMDTYEEPKLPFVDVTTEQIEKAFAAHNARYGFVVWSNQMAGTDEDCAERVKNDPDNYLGWSEDEVRQVSYEACSEDEDIIKSSMSSMDPHPILIHGTLGRWNGPKPVSAIKKSLLEIFNVFTGDGCTLYIQDGQLRAENAHHDGTDHFVIYGFRDGVDVEEAPWETQADVLRDTVSLVPMLDEHFGWKLGREFYPGKGKK